MHEDLRPIVILMADDDPDDRLLTQEAIEESRLINRLQFVEDGEHLLDYLFRRGPYTDETKYPMPDLILLDLNMPRLDGREALAIIKNDAKLRKIPVVILTTSKAEEDILRTYQLGANSYITKPVTFEGLVDVAKSIGRYWFTIVRLPSR
jgi:CheY-like chemotaxis protein